ncbi:MAG: 2-phosphosulfolactate phosphatase [Acidobacteriota bacterium]|nr:2-phosphosulfolactate phosphatase [Acidobacteriota bacterium]
MRIQRLSLLAGARQARGVAVAIDVLRASSHIVTLFDRGARAVVPAETLERAREFKRKNPDWILAGERRGLPPGGFEMGNSPFEAAARTFTGRTVILTTSAGSRGMVAAAEAGARVIVGCFLNARAVADHLRRIQPDDVSLLPLGVEGTRPAPEDEAAAAYIEALLEDRPFDLEAAFTEIRAHPEGRKFLDPAQPNYRPEDLDACLVADRIDRVPRLRGGRLEAPTGEIS